MAITINLDNTNFTKSDVLSPLRLVLIQQVSNYHRDKSPI